MPRGQLTKEEMKFLILRYKKQLSEEHPVQYSDPKSIADKYLNRILDKIDEYAS